MNEKEPKQEYKPFKSGSIGVWALVSGIWEWPVEIGTNSTECVTLKEVDAEKMKKS